MIPIQALPTVNAMLNSLSAILLITGYLCIRNGKITAHKTAMLSAFVTSSLFLISYLVYHYYTGTHPFPGQGWIRPVYFIVLISHTILAAAIVPMILVTLRRALSGRFQYHAQLARRTLPLWLYVSVTGVLVYWMLYQL